MLLQEYVFHLIPSLSHNTDLGIPKIQFNYYSVEGRTFQGHLEWLQNVSGIDMITS